MASYFNSHVQIFIQNYHMLKQLDEDLQIEKKNLLTYYQKSHQRISVKLQLNEAN